MTKTPHHTINIAIAGLGTVGCGLIEIIENLKKHEKNAPVVNIVAVSARDKNKQRPIDCKQYQWFDDPVSMAKDDKVDIVIELIGGEYGMAEQILKTAIEHKKSVITANKALLARNGFDIAELVEKHQVMIGWEAAVAGVIPIIANISNNLVADNVQSIFGILNGTCNYILTKMKQDKIDFDVALQDAQNLGLAEADPALDISGMDAAQKLALLASIAFHIKPNVNNIHVTGIEDIQYDDIVFAKSLGYDIKLIAHAEQMNDEIYLSVSPVLLKYDSSLAHIDGEMNAVAVNSQYAGLSMVTGAGAGAHPTAIAVTADLMNIIRHPNHSNHLFGISTTNLQQANYFSHDNYEAQYFIRITVKDIAGVLADIMAIMKEYGVSIDMFMQRATVERNKPSSGNVSLFMITHNTRYAVIFAALTQVKKFPFVIENALALPLHK